MVYILSFLEGILTFISPCLLPMLPIYIFYFAGHKQDGTTAKTLANATAFILGFTVVFLCLGAFAASLGGLLIRYQTVFNLVTGGIVITFGLSYLGVIPVLLPNLRAQSGKPVKVTGMLSAFLFGLVFSISWTPCVGAFLGSALMLASQQGSMLHGILMLLCYSAGLGIPFLISALLIDRLKGAFDWIKRHYHVIVRVSGGFLIAMGVLMATGRLGRLLALLS